MHNRARLLIIALSVFCSTILVAQNNLPMAFAVTYVTVTTTGTQTNDNCSIAEGGSNASTLNDRVWMACATSTSSSPTLAVYTMNGTQLATLSLSGISALNGGVFLMPLYSSGDANSILIQNSEDDVFQKYHYDGISTITLVGTFDPSCDLGSTSLPAYDSFGFMWFTCPAVHKVGAFNPSTMTSKYLSNALNGLSPSCQDPEGIAVDRQTSAVTSFYVFIVCTTNDELFIGTLSNSGNTYGSITALAASFAHTANTGTGDNVNVDEFNNRLIIPKDTQTGLQTRTYNGTGSNNPTLTTENTNVGSDISQRCYGLIPTASNNNTLFCAGTNSIQGFISDSSQFTNVINTAQFTTTISNFVSMVSTTLGNEYVIGQGALNNASQKFFVISDTLEINNNPTPPPPQGPPPTTVTGNCADEDVVCSDFCETPGNEFLLRCRAEGNGGSIITGNNTNTFNPIAGTNNLLVGALNLTDDDIRTNGVGYLLLAVALLLFNILFFIGVMVANNKGVIVTSPIYISALISLAIISAFTLFQWIDPLILIVSVVALVALATPKIVGIIRGSQTVGSSTD